MARSRSLARSLRYYTLPAILQESGVEGGWPCNRNPPQRTVVGVVTVEARLNTHNPPNNRTDESDEEVTRFFDDGPGFTSGSEQECQSLDGVGSPRTPCVIRLGPHCRAS
ncbi:hypothetical protein ALC53_03676 [Atta colombica]|uniref:Uncharacterized protein n=1 Tax=Atta colombica TaxID=520822 RepID=A0A195BNX4_9HYME|nr:hypothetical protein ALC53_03676 [Atta colombica]